MLLHTALPSIIFLCRLSSTSLLDSSTRGSCGSRTNQYRSGRACTGSYTARLPSTGTTCTATVQLLCVMHLRQTCAPTYLYNSTCRYCGALLRQKEPTTYTHVLLSSVAVSLIFIWQSTFLDGSREVLRNHLHKSHVGEHQHSYYLKGPCDTELACHFYRLF